MEGISATAFTLMFILLAINFMMKRGNSNLPPGPTGLPLVGYLPFLGQLPFLQFAKLRKRYGDVFMVDLGARQCVVINGIENLKAAFLSTTFSDRPDFKTFSLINEGKSLAFTNGGASGRLHRKICQKALSLFINSKLFPFENILESASTSMCREIDDHVGEPFVPHQTVRDHTTSVMFKICFGRDADIREDPYFRNMRTVLDDFNESIKPVAVVDFIPSMETWLSYKLETVRSHLARYQRLVQDKLDEHLGSYDGEVIRDATDALIRHCEAEEEQLQRVGLGRREILHSVQDFIAAGSTTTSDVIIWLIAFLVHNPDVQEKLYHEIEMKGHLRGRINEFADHSAMPYMWATILEVSRIRPVSPLALPHATSDDVCFASFDIPKGTLVFPNLCSVLHDEAIYPNPHHFRPERFLKPDGTFNRDYVDKIPIFGIGKRRCIGEQLGKIELFYFLSDIVKRFQFRGIVDNMPNMDGNMTILWQPDEFAIIAERR